MSGGSLSYFYNDLEEHVGDLGDKELDGLVKDLAVLFHDREWYLSADTGEGDWVESRDAFKAKWFTPEGRRERIEGYFDEWKQEALSSLGLSDSYCKNCKHWIPEICKRHDGLDSPYGDCDITEGCLMHRSESCGKFERREGE